MEKIISSKFGLGPMSKNIVDTVIEYCNSQNVNITLIPSRRQVEYDGGYVCNWTTEEFTRYVKSKTNNIALQRDHGGPGQGLNDDNGEQSLSHDCNLFDSIHIDPWKQYQDMELAISSTIHLLKYCHEQNSELYYEIGTEEAIRPISVDELDYFLNAIKTGISELLWSRILFVVIQSGTKLQDGINTGEYNDDKLKAMIDVTLKYNKLSKEHNGDFMGNAIMKNRFDNRLNAINIAPELGIIETETILSVITDVEFELFYQICFNSGKWKKWVKNIDPNENKKEIVRISGHYVFNHEQIKNILENYPDLDAIICENIKTFLYQIHNTC